MPHTYAQNTLHIIFSTKDRRFTLRPCRWQGRMGNPFPKIFNETSGPTSPASAKITESSRTPSAAPPTTSIS